MIIVIFAYKLSRGGNDGKLLKISTILAKRERERGGRKRPKRGPSEKEKWGGEKAADSDGEEEEKEGGVEPSRQKLQV